MWGRPSCGGRTTPPLGRAARNAEIPGKILRASPSATALARLPIDHAIAPVPYAGGSEAADALVDPFIARKPARSAHDHNEPEAASTSGL